MGRCNGINIVDSTIRTGDDCISIGHGSRNVNIQRVICGPGHGISIGSLGKRKGEKPVSHVSVTNCTFLNTHNGVRIKTWPTSNTGIVDDVRFEDLVMHGVRIPILIDQEYCPHNRCGNEVCTTLKQQKMLILKYTRFIIKMYHVIVICFATVSYINF